MIPRYSGCVVPLKILWPRNSLEFVWSSRDFFGFWFFPPFNHPCHLKSGIPPLGPSYFHRKQKLTWRMGYQAWNFQNMYKMKKKVDYLSHCNLYVFRALYCMIYVISMEFPSLSCRRSSTRNIPSGEEREEADFPAGYLLQSPSQFDVSSVNDVQKCHCWRHQFCHLFVFSQSRAKVSASFTNVSGLAVAAFDLDTAPCLSSQFVFVLNFSK